MELSTIFEMTLVFDAFIARVYSSEEYKGDELTKIKTSLAKTDKPLFDSTLVQGHMSEMRAPFLSEHSVRLQASSKSSCFTA